MKFLISILLLVGGFAAHAGLDDVQSILQNPDVRKAFGPTDPLGVSVQQVTSGACIADYMVQAEYTDGHCTLPVRMNRCGVAAANAAVGTLNCAQLNSGTAAPSFATDIKPMFQAKCAMCHGAGKAKPVDYTVYKNALAGKDDINKHVVVAKDMPMGLPFDQKSRDLVANWLAGGALP